MAARRYYLNADPIQGNGHVCRPELFPGGKGGWLAGFVGCEHGRIPDRDRRVLSGQLPEDPGNGFPPRPHPPAQPENSETYSLDNYVPPRNKHEEAVVEIWKKVLGTNAI